MPVRKKRNHNSVCKIKIERAMKQKIHLASDASDELKVDS